MKRHVALSVLVVVLAACDGSGSDKDYLLGVVRDTQAKVVTCKDEDSLEKIGDCMADSMQALQTEWTENIDRLKGMNEKDAEEVATAYSGLSMTIQQELMQIMTQQMQATE